jgi:hypothetical protein
MLLTVKHQKLKDEIKQIETIRRFSDNIGKEIAPPTKKRDKDISL